jgi:hypothetical protein
MPITNAGSLLTLFALCICFTVVPASANVDFLTDYSNLEEHPQDAEVLMYVAPGAFEKIGEYKKVFVDQPEIFISASSKYRGLKPDDMKLLADSLRNAITSQIGELYEKTDQPGSGVLYVRLALVDLHLRKPKRGLLSFTPVGALAHAARSTMQNDLTKKISLVEVTIETELIDGSSGEILAAMIEHRGQAKNRKLKQREKASSWDEINLLLQGYSARVKCRLHNTRVSEDQRQQCRTSLLENGAELR